MTLPAALPGERFDFTHPSAGRIGLYAAGEGAGPPLLLVHSVNAAAAASEVRPLFEHYRASRRVFAIDLPGYGSSDRSDRDYTPRLMVDALHGAVAQIRARCGPVPVDALAVSLGCEFLARAAMEAPGAFRSLALVSPTDLRGGQAGRGAPGSTRAMPWLRAALRGPGTGWGGGLFRTLTRPGVIRHFLRKTWGGRDIDDTMWAYAVRTAQEPGAEHAPLCFLSGGLFSADIHAVYEALTVPVWMSHGVRGDFTDYRGKAFLAHRPNWRFTVFQTGALPYFEVGAESDAAYDAFLASATTAG
ncbi:alpha/beta fold hydrolase [Ideonella sp. A 288]|uniref:alpha/beta fold hydrolase n=1 Tax=Ideonella sp. A 288 TaxID=1962181 RepID=UPI000B4BBC40|nr:alpha/beta hydrolase [Ideonella sp. A 288]